MLCSPKSPNSMFEPRHATPRLLPFCIFLNFVRFGESIFVPQVMRRALRARTSPLNIQTLTPMMP